MDMRVHYPAVLRHEVVNDEFQPYCTLFFDSNTALSRVNMSAPISVVTARYGPYIPSNRDCSAELYPSQLYISKMQVNVETEAWTAKTRSTRGTNGSLRRIAGIAQRHVGNWYTSSTIE